MSLPSGWSESRPDGMAINPDPIYGGIIDRGIVDQRWVVIHNDPELSGIIDDLASREDAVAAFNEKLHSHIAIQMAKYASSVGVGERVVPELIKTKVQAGEGNSGQLLSGVALPEQISRALATGVTPDELAGAIWGEGTTWVYVAASYARTSDELAKVWEGAGFELACLGGDSYGLCASAAGVQFVLTDNAESSCPNPDFRLHAAAYSQDGEFIDVELPAGNLAAGADSLEDWASMALERLDSAEQSRRMKGPGM